jgi:hypothetical protein
MPHSGELLQAKRNTKHGGTASTLFRWTGSFVDQALFRLRLSERRPFALRPGVDLSRVSNAPPEGLERCQELRAEGLRVVAEGHPETENAYGLQVCLASAGIAG